MTATRERNYRVARLEESFSKCGIAWNEALVYHAFRYTRQSG